MRDHVCPQDKTTPLFIATISGHVGVVRALIEAGAEVDVECGDAAVTEVRPFPADIRRTALLFRDRVDNHATGASESPSESTVTIRRLWDVRATPYS